jgi:hypothetical protein
MLNYILEFLPVLIFVLFIIKSFQNVSKNNKKTQILKKNDHDLTLLEEEKLKSQIPPLPQSYQEIIEKNIWSKLLNFHESKGLKYGAYETDKYVELIMPIEDNNPRFYFQMIQGNCLYFKVSIIENFPVEVTTDLFILTTHFNNALNFGTLHVNANNREVIYSLKNELDFYSTFPEKIERDISNHYTVSLDIYWAFNKYLNEREDPAFIFAEFMEMINKKE